jgi:uncharacterized membrane protein
MKVTYRISEDDYAKARWLHEKFAWLRVGIIYLLASVALSVWCFDYAWHDLPDDVIGDDLLGAFGGCLVAGLILRYIIFLTSARKYYRKCKAIYKEFSTELFDGGVRIAAPYGDAKLVWEIIMKWRQDKNYILIYLTPSVFYILPKSIAASGFDVPMLIRQLAEHVGKLR